jgi:putative hydrolase of the HAD superfamily
MRALLFDIGNVLVTFDFHRSASRMAERSSLSKQAIFDAIDPLKVPFESGAMPEDEFVFRAMDAIDFNGSADEFRDMWCDIFALNEPMAQTLATLPAKVPAYLLSNTNGPHLRFLTERFSIFKHFDGGIYSHEAKTMKPGEGIFEQVIAKYALDPAQTFYVDDLVGNIETGRRLGFVSHHYDPKNHAPLHRELNAWLTHPSSLLL